MRKWQELLDKLEGRKILLSGFKNTMNMFREIENIQEELKEIEVRNPGLLVIWQNMSKFWNFVIFKFFMLFSFSFWMKVLFLLYLTSNSEELRDSKRICEIFMNNKKKDHKHLIFYHTFFTCTIASPTYLIYKLFSFFLPVQSTSKRHREAPAGDGGLPPTAQFTGDPAQSPVQEGP